MTKLILDFSQKVLLLEPSEFLSKKNKAELIPLDVAKLYNHTLLIEHLTNPGGGLFPSKL